MEVGNNIAVKYAVYSDKVRYNTYEGNLIVFNNDKLVAKLPLVTLMFTGIKVVLNNKVSMLCTDGVGAIVEHSIWEGWLYLEPKNKEDFIGIINFIPAVTNTIVTEFYGNFIEVTNESI